MGKSNISAPAIRRSFHFFIESPFQQAIASWYTDRFWSGITRFSSIPMILPYPSHTGQAPMGLLKLKKYSVGSSNSIPSSSNFVEKLSRLRPSSDCTITWQCPFPVWNAVAAESAERLKLSESWLITSLSITILTLCPGLNSFSVPCPSILISSPSTSMRLNPCFTRNEKYSDGLMLSGIVPGDTMITFVPSDWVAR